MRLERFSSRLRTAGRWAVEIVVALLFLLIAAEQLAHRHFSPEPRFHAALVLLAIAIGAVGVAPLLFHVSPRLLLLVGAVLASVLVGFAVLAALHHAA